MAIVTLQVQDQAGKSIHNSGLVLTRPVHSRKTDSSRLGTGAHGQGSDKDGSPVLSLKGSTASHMILTMASEAGGAHRGPSQQVFSLKKP